MKPPFTELTVSNFRTIRGQIVVPLDAPIVLIHGANGAGKTSLLSAMELAATGAVQALADFDPGYAAHLAHVDGGPCFVGLAGDSGGDSNVSSEVRVVGGRLEGQALFPPPLRRFFSDRSFLAQSRLSRLLEIYQHAAAREESPLVRFVNELLGLDQLDDLISGLHPALDERRVRRLVPDYESQQRESGELESSVSRLNASLGDMRALVRQRLDALRAALGLEPTRGVAPSQTDLVDVAALLGPDGSEDELEVLRSSKQRLAAIESRMNELPPAVLSAESALVAAEGAAAAEANWRSGPGQALADVLTASESATGPMGVDWRVDPQAAWREALDRVRAALERERLSVAEDRSRAAQTDALSRELEATRRELAEADRNLADLTLNWDSLVEALAAIEPHLDTDECPVCGRDFAEMGSGSLRAHLRAVIDNYSAEGARVQAVLLSRSALQQRVTQVADALENAQRARLSTPLREASEQREEVLSTLEARLVALSTEAARGSVLIDDARRQLRESRESGAAQALEVSLRSEVAAEWHRSVGRDTEPPADLPAALVELRRVAASRQVVLDEHIQTRQSLRGQLQDIEDQLANIENLEQRRSRDQRLLAVRTAALSQARQRFMSARQLANTASRTRAEIVARVFNGALNKTWNDLFIRLAAGEPYVPFFGIPTTDRRLTSVELRTRHRVGTSGGSPGAMLSAGNLNTAALTLFLALHLTAEPQVRCLVLDDPVQSMDEVHVAQLAALLRTLARQHERQIILAVHERALFEYLRLEMSPAASGSELITLELERHDGADTECHVTVVPWTEDRSVLAIADSA